MSETSENKPLLVVYNNHGSDSGKPPSYASTPHSSQYLGYYANEHGEQWVFVYDYHTERGILRGGDVEWGNEYTVVDGKVSNLLLSQSEAVWLLACWVAASQFKEERQRRRVSEE